MSHHLLVIEDESTPTEASVCAALRGDSDFHCRRLSWERLAPDCFGHPAHGIVAVAVPRIAAAENTFRWLLENPVVAPTFAVLPADVEGRLLRAAACSVDDFMLSPLRQPELRQRLSRLLGPPRCEIDAVREKLLEELGRAQLIGKDPAFLRVVEQIPRFAGSDMPVLIAGETGTGKELCARAIHFFGRRRDFPFIAVDCGAIPDHLIENELFGHARGAYTDAHRDYRGLIAMAEGGTLFLDEVDSLSLSAQAKLLRFLQERTFRPLGSDRFLRADVNVVAATNRDLDAAVRDRRFRSDLYFRLHVLQLYLPALRQRPGDIVPLALHFLRELQGGAQERKALSAAAMRKMEAYDWPGNVRELSNVVRRAFALSPPGHILPEHIAFPDAGGPAGAPAGQGFRAARAEAIAAFERRYAEDLLLRHRGNVTRAAREAQKDRRAFGRLVKKYRLSAPRR